VQLKQIIQHLNKQGISVDLLGDDTIEISQVSGLDIAKKGEISFLTDKKYLSHLETSSASAVLISKVNSGEYPFTQVIVENPYYVYALVAQLLNPFKVADGQIHSSAVVSSSTHLGINSSVEANVVIEDDVTIGSDSIISAGSVIESSVTIGKNCRIEPNVTIYNNCVIGDNVIIKAGAVIGGDGFGWANNKGQWVKIPQIGRVIIGNNVSIGSNVTIDRGAIENTIIEDNCIIDNQVHLGHNVVIGSGSAIVAQAGFAGSTLLGKNCTVAGQVGFGGHLAVADNCHFAARAGVTHDINEPGAYAGFPAIKAIEWQKNNVRSRQLDKMAKQIKQLEKKLESLIK